MKRTDRNIDRPRFEDLHDVLNVQEAARFLGIGKDCYYDAIERKEVPFVKVGGRYIVPKAALRRYLENGGMPTDNHAA